MSELPIVVLEDEVLKTNPLEGAGGEFTDQTDDQQPVEIPNEVQQPADPLNLQELSVAPLTEENSARLLKPDAILGILEDANVGVFPAQDKLIFAKFPLTSSTGPCLAIWPLESIQSKVLIINLINQTHPGTPHPGALNAVLEILKLKAISEQEIRLGNRFQEADGCLWIDLLTEDHQLVKLDANGWDIVPQAQPLFRRFSHQMQQVIPRRGGDHKKLFDFMDLPDPEHQLLVTTWILASFYSDNREVPILFLTGGQGAGKTTICSLIRGILDPSREATLGEIPDRELDQMFYQHAVPCLENVSNISRKRADRYCRITTGMSSPRRKLYTDSEMVHISCRRPLLMNGIAAPSKYPDFLDRTILIPLTRRQVFLSKHQFDSDFERAKPEILGGFLDLLVSVLKNLDSVSSTSENRMADFTYFGRAVAVALGKQADEFDRCYLENRKPNYELQLEDTPWIQIIVNFAKAYPKGAGTEWRGTATELQAALKEQGIKMNLPDAVKDLPKSPASLSRRLKELAPALGSQGVFVEDIPRTSNKRGISVYV